MQFLYIEGLYFSTPNVASIFQPCIPVLTALFAFMVCMEPLPSRDRLYQWLKVLGILFGAGGAILMSVSRPDSAVATIAAAHYKNSTCNGAAIANSSASWAAGSCHAAPYPLLAVLGNGTPPAGAYWQVDCLGVNANISFSRCSARNADNGTCSGCMTPRIVPSAACGVGNWTFTCSKPGAANNVSTEGSSLALLVGPSRSALLVRRVFPAQALNY